MRDFWVFGYGSLMWNPGFAVAERRRARLFGYHRALCVHSFVHRGTQEHPGLVLGLDRGGSCTGVAFRLHAGDEEAVVAYLRERELVTHVYVERRLNVLPEGGAPVEALTYVVDRSHCQYAGRLADTEVLRVVSGAQGKSGINRDYVINTVDHLRQLGVHDPHLETLADGLGAGSLATAIK